LFVFGAPARFNPLSILRHEFDNSIQAVPLWSFERHRAVKLPGLAQSDNSLVLSQKLISNFDDFVSGVMFTFRKKSSVTKVPNFHRGYL
jgi:hypothetical protein